jgi:N-acetyl-anhydromuramyl-L-alanine amidase AmpD
VSLLAGGVAVVAAPTASAADWSRCLDGTADRQSVFERAAEVSGVPETVLLGVSYLQSRWDDHGASPSASGGYGPMHLTDFTGLEDPKAADKGESAPVVPDAAGTLTKAAELTGFSARSLRADDVANICGGAAVLASYQKSTTAADPAAWTRAVASYSGAGDEGTALRFADQVFEVIREGETRTTNDGEKVTLKASPDAQPDEQAVASMGLLEPENDVVDCPASLGCESIPAPYEWYDKSSPYNYGNHDLADRPNDMDIDYIVVHNTEGNWQTALDLVTDPTYLAWHYTLRSSDGHIAQHVNNKNVGWQAGNWYVNMHSIGLEHEGIAAEGATWFTESMYRTSAALVKHLAEKYDVPLDRAHIIGHDQIPGVTPANVRGMHWDTGPYWDWEHYMSLMGAPIERDKRGRSDVVTVAPGFDDNQQPVTGCVTGGVACEEQGTNFTYLRTAPSEDAPLVKDAGLHPDGSHSTTEVWDIGARAQAGLKFLVADKLDDWLGVWYLGDIAWLKKDDVVKSTGKVVVPSGDTEVPVYGRAYPEESAYPAEIPYQPLAPLQYTLKPGQAYVVADDDLATDYYYAKTFNDAIPGDHTVVVGEDEYYQIWFGHRFAYVRAADVSVKDGVAKLL